MGIYYHYVNLDLREHFAVGVGRGADKIHGVGRGLGARALGLLLLPGARWSGHRVLVVGDDAELPKEIRAAFPSTRLTTGELLVEAFRAVEWLPLRVLLESDRESISRLLAGPERDLAVLASVYAFARAHVLEGYSAALKKIHGKGWRRRARAHEHNGFADALETLYGEKWAKRVRELLIEGDREVEDELLLESLPYDDFEFPG